MVPGPEPAECPCCTTRATGGGHDGLGAVGLNDNQGAESTLAFRQALIALGGRSSGPDSAPALSSHSAHGRRRARWHPLTVCGMASSPGDISDRSRSAATPAIRCSRRQRWPYPINAVMNAGAAVVDGNTMLLCRVEDRRGFSHLTVARPRDGVSNWVVDDDAAAGARPRSGARTVGAGGPADHPGRRARRLGDRLHLVRSRRARASRWPPPRTSAPSQRLGMVRAPEDKNGALLPRRVDGDFVLFHRPVTAVGARADVWLSRSADLRSWSAPEPVFAAREGGWWDSARIGIGPAAAGDPARAGC